MKYPCNFDDYNTLIMSNYKEIVVLNDVQVEIPIVGSLETGSNILHAGNTDSSFVGWYLWLGIDSRVSFTGLFKNGNSVKYFLYKRRTLIEQLILIKELTNDAVEDLHVGEYVFVAQPGKTQIRFECVVNSNSQTIQSAKRPFKIKESWFPHNLFETLKNNGFNKLTEIKIQTNYNKLLKAGLNKKLLDELVLLAPYLDVPTISYQYAAHAIRNKINPIKNNNGKLNQPINLEGLLLDGGLNPTDNDLPCISIGTISGVIDNNDLNPKVDWNWYNEDGEIDHLIINRPWWEVPDNYDFNENEVQNYWYPDSQKGWRVFGYQFGGSPNQIGYLLVYNIITGVLRLFIYLPNVQERNFNKLLVKISLVNSERTAVKTWSFPLVDIPPNVVLPQANTQKTRFWDLITNWFNNRKEDEVIISEAYTPTFTWPGLNEAFHDLTASSSTADGKWLRTETATLFDPLLYPETQPLRALGGCLGLLFPNVDANANELKETDRRLLRLDFKGILEGQVNLEANLSLNLSGKGIPSTSIEEDQFGTIKNYISTSVNALKGAWEIKDFISTAVAAGSVELAAAAKAAGVIYSLIQSENEDTPTEYDIKLMGAATGKIEGTTVFVLPVSDFEINLTGTFESTTIMTENGPVYLPLGWPQTYQRCNKIRFGTYGFKAADEVGIAFGNDPRPNSIEVEWIPADEFAQNYYALVKVSPIGLFQVAPWADMTITAQYAELERFHRNATLPHTITTIRRLEVNQQNQFRLTSPSDLVNLGENEQIRIRWVALFTPANTLVPPFEITYVLDLIGKTNFIIPVMPGSGDVPDDDWN